MTLKTISAAQLTGLRNLWTAGIHSNPVKLKHIDSGRATRIVARALMGRGLVRLAHDNVRHETLELTGDGRALATRMGWQSVDTTPTIEQRRQQLEASIDAKLPFAGEIELLIATALHWGRRHAAELLELQADQLEAVLGAETDQSAHVQQLRSSAREINGLTTRFENGTYVSRPRA